MVNHTHVVIEHAMDTRPLKRKLPILKRTVSDNAAPVTLLTEIEKNIGEWVKNVTEPTIQLRRDIGDSKNMDDMADLVGEAKGKVYFDKFRGQIATFIEREETLLAKREENTQETSSYGSENDSAK